MPAFKHSVGTFGKKMHQPPLGIAKPTENFRSMAGITKKKHTLYNAADNARDLHTELSSNLNLFLKHKSSLEMAIKQKERKITFLQQTLDSQNSLIMKLQLDQEKLSGQYSNDQQYKEEILQKYLLVKEQCLALKRPFEQLQSQLDRCNETCRMIDASEMEREMKMRELEEKFIELTMSHQQKVSIMNEALEVRDQEVAELQHNFGLATLEHSKQVEALNKAIENGKHEVSHYQKMLVESDNNLQKEQKHKEELMAEIASLKLTDDDRLKELQDKSSIIKKLEADMHKLQENYNTASHCVSELQIAHAHIEEEIKECQEEKMQQFISCQKQIAELDAENAKAQQRAIELADECNTVKSQLAEMEAQKEGITANFQNLLTAEKAEREMIETRLITMEENLKTLSEERASLLSEIDSYKQALEPLELENTSSKKLLDEEKLAKQALCTEVTELKTMLASLELNSKVETERMQEKLADLMNEKLMIENNLDLSRKEIADERMKSEKLSKLHIEQMDLAKTLKTEVEKLREEISLLELQNQDYEKQLFSSKIQIEECQKNCSYFKDQKEELEGILASKEQELLKCQLNDEDKIKAMKKELMEKTDEIHKTKDEIKNLKMKLKGKEGDIEFLQQANNNHTVQFGDQNLLVENLKKECEVYNKKLKDLEKKLKTKEDSIKNLQNTINKLKEDLSDEERKSSSTKKDQSELADKVASMEKMIAEKDKEIARLKNQIDEMKVSLEAHTVEEYKTKEMSEEIGKLKAEKQRNYTDEIMKKGHDMVALKDKIRSLEQQIFLKENEISKLQSEIAKMPANAAKERGKGAVMKNNSFASSSSDPETPTNETKHDDGRWGRENTKVGFVQPVSYKNKKQVQGNWRHPSQNKRSSSFVSLRSPPALKKEKVAKEPLQSVQNSCNASPCDEKETSGSDYLDFEVDEQSKTYKLFAVKSNGMNSLSCTPSEPSSKTGSRQTPKISANPPVKPKGSSRVTKNQQKAKKEDQEVKQLSESRKPGPSKNLHSSARKPTPSIFKRLLTNANSNPRKFFPSRSSNEKPSDALKKMSSLEKDDPFVFDDF